MYNFNNLNDYEFEILCKNILERALNKKLFFFPRGKDGGIDISDGEKKHKIIAQVKHYSQSKFSALLASLKKEASRIEEKEIDFYYVMTSLSLTLKNKEEIVSLFPKTMPNIEYIWDAIPINEFLEKEENFDIVQKNFKLWLCSSQIISLILNQSMFLDCEELRFDIEEESIFFVETSSYRESKIILENSNILILTGGPGVGKSTISKMLLLYFLSNQYKIKYTTNNNLSEIKANLSRDTAQKEIILLDDFLGQHYLKMDEKQPNELKTLISFVEKSPNKKLIMNSRITILNEATSSFIKFKELIEKKDVSKHIIDIEKISPIEKAHILYNHLFFNNLPSDYFNEIKSNENYLKIINHKNYNPRIIEYVTKEYRYKQIKSFQYFAYIINNLDNPLDVWEDEFRNRLEEVDRSLMYTLYSLTDTEIDDEILCTVYNESLISKKNDLTLNTYQTVLKRLNESLLKIYYCSQQKTKKIKCVNPSINDYMKTCLKNNKNLQEDIIKNSTYAEQIIKISNLESAAEKIKELILNGKFLNLKTLKKTNFYYYLKMIIKYEIFNEKIQIDVLNSISKSAENSYYHDYDFSNLLDDLFDKNFYEFYNLKIIFTNPILVRDILKKVYFINNIEIINYIIKKNSINNELLDIFKILLIDTSNDFIDDYCYDIMSDTVDTVVSKYSIDPEDDFEITICSLEEKVFIMLEEKITMELETQLLEIDPILNLKIRDFPAFDKYRYDVTSLIEELLNPQKNNEQISNSNVIDELQEINYMFKR
ncbi:MAG: hypothetical protein ACRCXY_01600 [Fusobacteriaceae bacterium]